MKNLSNKAYKKREGASLTTTLVLMGLAVLTIASVMPTLQSDANISKSNHERDKALLLAEAGLNAAMAKLILTSNPEISSARSKDYFSDHTPFGTKSWGFSTEIQSIGGTNDILVSTGTYGSKEQKVQASVRSVAGADDIHWLYAFALYAGNSSRTNVYTMEIGGSGSYADYVKGDAYSALNLRVSGDAELRLPEIINEVVFDGIYDDQRETYQNAYATQFFSNALSQVAYDAYVASVAPYSSQFYNNGKYDYGEPFLDNAGNGIYDLGEPFTDLNGNGVRDAGDGYNDLNNNGIYDEGIDTVFETGNGVWDEGEQWVDNTGGAHNKRRNGRYDPAGGYYNSKGKWKTDYKKKGKRYYCSSWPPEQFADSGSDEVVDFDPGEPWVDGNGIYDDGELYLDDRNEEYDYGTQAYGTVLGMPSPGPGQRASTGGDRLIPPPDLVHMFYGTSKDQFTPIGALDRWGHDIKVSEDDYSSNGKLITDSSKPEHIFTRNIRQSPAGQGNGYYRDTISGVTVRSRGYSLIYDDNEQRVDDYFLEDPTDYYYTRTDDNNSIDGTSYTSPSYINVKPEHNNKVYFVEGNLYLHASPTFCMMFKQPGTRITIVAEGNIFISDEFYYNADYDPNLSRSDVNSTIVQNPSDALCLIALKNPDCANSGNILIGDPAHGTGGSIHAMLYAENNFVDNNLNTSGQPFISIFGNMTAGNHVILNRPNSGSSRTRLDITLDERIRNGEIIMPGLPHPLRGSIAGGIDLGNDTEDSWQLISGSWKLRSSAE